MAVVVRCKLICYSIFACIHILYFVEWIYVILNCKKQNRNFFFSHLMLTSQPPLIQTCPHPWSVLIELTGCACTSSCHVWYLNEDGSFTVLLLVFIVSLQLVQRWKWRTSRSRQKSAQWDSCRAQHVQAGSVTSPPTSIYIYVLKWCVHISIRDSYILLWPFSFQVFLSKTTLARNLMIRTHSAE